MSSGNPRSRDLKETAEEWLEFADRIKMPVQQQLDNARKAMSKVNIKVDKICTCGVESIGTGMHSDWCEKRGE